MTFSNLIKPEIEHYIDECNFTKDEMEIFTKLSKGKSTIDVSNTMCISVSCVNKKISNIKHKMKRVDEMKKAGI